MATKETEMESLDDKQTTKLTAVAEHDVPVVRREVKTRFGSVWVHIQGELSSDGHKAVFLTVHDIGANHSSMQDFVDSESMLEIKARSVFIHLDVLGQEDASEDLKDSEEFPTIIQGEELIPEVLDSLKVPLVVGIGEGGGANILARFGLRHPQRVLGLVLVHLVSTEVGFLETLKERLFHRRNSQQMPLEDIIKLHKIGDQNRDDENNKRLCEDYQKRVQTLNARNVKKYAQAYAMRKEISSLGDLDVLLICGGKSLYCAGVEALHSKCNKTKTSLLKVDESVDPINDQSDKVAQSLLLFVKGLGFLTSCPTEGSGRGSDAGLKTLGSIGRRRTLSMEEYDIPRMRRLSLTK